MQHRHKRTERSKENLYKALESVLYEMLILSTALLLRDKRYFFERYPGLEWGPAKIADDVIRLKVRLLLDFFYPKSRNRQDILVHDFEINPLKMLDRATLRRLDRFRDKVNKRTIHLSWVRTEEEVYSKSDRESMERYAVDLLSLGDNFIEGCLVTGFQLDGWAKAYCDNFKRVYAYLNATPRVEEGKAKRPASLISLEALGRSV